MAALRPLSLRFSDRARQQLNSIQSYLRERNPHAARRVGVAIRDSAERLRYFPFAGRPGRANGTREWVVRGYPYVIVYELRRAESELMILGVFHAAQNR